MGSFPANGELGAPPPPQQAAAGPAKAGSGPVVARLFHRALAVVFLIAWWSLGRQVLVLVGARGLLPLADFVAAARAENALSFWRFPSLLAWSPADATLVWGTVAGAALALVALAGWRPRLCAAVQTVWYLGYVTACRSFLGFQWDNLLLECGFLAAFLPVNRPAPLAHLLFRAVLFKLYFESGLAKWQSPLHDWQDGTAMTFYYETAPLPTALAWYAHHLPRWWHLLESRATLVLELVVPLAIFGPRRGRLAAAALFTLFQVVNAATANYGFFCYLAAALHLFLFSDADASAARVWMGTRAVALARHRLFPPMSPPWPRRRRSRAGAPPAPPGAAVAPPRPVYITRRAAAWVGLSAWLAVSLLEAWFHFGDPGPAALPFVPVLEWSQTFRLVNAFHLFAAVTRERIEPEFQLQQADGGPWVAYDLRYKAGEPGRRPPFVAPHQPRVDFLLWFYGLGFQRRPPTYVSELLARLCEAPQTVAPLFRADLPRAPAAARVVFWDYRFTTAAERRATGAWWTRRQVGETAPLPCR